MMKKIEILGYPYYFHNDITTKQIVMWIQQNMNKFNFTSDVTVHYCSEFGIEFLLNGSCIDAIEVDVINVIYPHEIKTNEEQYDDQHEADVAYAEMRNS